MLVLPGFYADQFHVIHEECQIVDLQAQLVARVVQFYAISTSVPVVVLYHPLLLVMLRLRLEACQFFGENNSNYSSRGTTVLD